LTQGHKSISRKVINLFHRFMTIFYWISIFSADRLPCAQFEAGTLDEHAPPCRVPPSACLRVNRPASRRLGEGAAYPLKGLYTPSMIAPHRAPGAPCRRGRVPHRQDRRLPRLAALALGSAGVLHCRHNLFNLHLRRPLLLGPTARVLPYSRCCCLQLCWEPTASHRRDTRKQRHMILRCWCRMTAVASCSRCVALMG